MILSSFFNSTKPNCLGVSQTMLTVDSKPSPIAFKETLIMKISQETRERWAQETFSGWSLEKELCIQQCPIALKNTASGSNCG